MNNSELLKEFFDSVSSWATIPVDFGGRTFEQPNGYWLQLIHNINDLDPDLSGDNVIRRGMFQINVCSPKDRSLLVLRDLAEFVESQYPKGTSVGSVKVTGSPRMMSEDYEPTRIVIAVYFTYSE